jgi:aarF domain-containing kinase
VQVMIGENVHKSFTFHLLKLSCSFATSTRCPTTMIFVPSKDGISHNEREFTSKGDCALGAQVLLGAVLRYDQMRISQTGLHGLHTSSRSVIASRSFSSSSKRSDETTKPKDARPFSKKYPPVTPLPKPVNFDQPAVSNPIMTAEAHTRFRKQAKWAGVILLGASIIGGIVYYSMEVGHADEGDVHSRLNDSGRDIQIAKGYHLANEQMDQRIQEAQKELGHGSYTVLAIKRSTTIAKAVGLCVWDYRKTLNKKYSSKAEESEALRQCHLRSAHRVLKALQENGGLYIKLGQHISAVILLPVEWTDTMKPLQDQNTPTPLSELGKMFQAETGFTFEEAFTEMDEKPIGVASLAQVHRAVDRKTGMNLAIKLMHPEVERFSEVDMRTVNVLVKWVKKAFPQFEFTWLAEEMNENLPLEMDFRHEAKNAERAAKDFEDMKKTTIYIPKVPWVYKRVMAMEYIDGRRPDDLQYLAKHNIDRNRVSQELSRIFAQMLYLNGFFHADPHGGNVLIRPAQRNSRSPFNFEVVLLDHGLYFDIDQDLRTNYARFWLSLLSKSTPKVKKERRRLAKEIANIDDNLYPILESAITGRSGLEGSDDKNPSGVKGSKRKSSLLDLDSGTGMSPDEQEHIRNTVMAKEGLFLDILQVLRMVPRRMLMVLKLNDLTRALDASLHTTHGLARPFIITARYCSLAVWQDDKSTMARRYRENGLSLQLLSDYISSIFSFLWFNQGLRFAEALSDLNATRKKFFSFSAAFAKCFNLTNARRASSGLDSQAQRQAIQHEEKQRATKEIDDESKQYHQK